MATFLEKVHVDSITKVHLCIKKIEISYKYLLGELLLGNSHQGIFTVKKGKNQQSIYAGSTEKKITIPTPKEK